MSPFFKKRFASSVVLVIIIVLSGALLLTPSKKAEAFWGIGDTVAEVGKNLVENTISAAEDVAQTLALTKGYMKEWVLDPAITSAKQKIIDRVTQATVNWINSGFEGSPTYVQNPKNFMQNTADTIAGAFIKQSNLGFMCSPFDITLALSMEYNTGFKQEEGCTLSDVIDNTESFIQENNFEKGGWDGFYELAAKGQNDPYSQYLDAKAQLDLKISNAQDRKKKMLARGEGFMSKTECERKYSMETPQSTACDNGELIEQGGTTYCCIGKHTVTPGSVINKQLNSTLQEAGIGQLKLADEINEVVSALIAQLAQNAMKSLADMSSSEGGTGTGEVETPDVLKERAIDQVNSRKNDIVNRENEYKNYKEDSLTSVNNTENLLESLISCYQDHLDYEQELENDGDTSACHLTETEEQTARDRIAQASSTISTTIDPLQERLNDDIAKAERIITQTNETASSSISTIRNDSSSTSTSAALNNFTDTVDSFDVVNPDEVGDALQEKNQIQRQMSSLQSDTQDKLETCRSFPPPEDDDSETPEVCDAPLPPGY